MAFGDGGQIVSGASTANNQTALTVATSAAVNVGEIAVVLVCVDNISTGGGDTLEVSGVTIGGRAMTKVRQNSTNVAAQAGSSVSIWIHQVTGSNIASASNVVASFTNSGTSDASAMTGRKFTVASGNLYDIVGTNATTSTTTTPGSLDVTGANVEHLRIRAIGCEFDTTQALTVTASWTAFTEAGSAATGTITEQVIEGEFRIVTGTNGASNPTLGSACDSASVYVALREIEQLLGQAIL